MKKNNQTKNLQKIEKIYIYYSLIKIYLLQLGIGIISLNNHVLEHFLTKY